MHKKDIVLGFLMGLLGTAIGIVLYSIFIGLNLGMTMSEIIDYACSSQFIGKKTSIGALVNLPLFYFFLNKNKEKIAQGILTAISVIAVIFIVFWILSFF